LEPILVIDFGTAYSCAALVTGDDVKWLHEPSSGLIDWPSGVLVDGDDILVGSVADRRKVVRALLYRSEIKRYLSRGEPLDIGGEEYAPESLVSAVLAAFHAAAVKVNDGGPVLHAVLTKPADYLPGDARNRRMISAGEAAGLGLVELLPEPVAAAYSAPGGAEYAPGSILLVYDWGGGTFDAALIRILADGSEVLASDGLAYCGGVDVDMAVARYLCVRDAELGALFASGDKGRILVRDLADRLKRELSDRPDSLQDVMGIEAALSAAEFEKIAEPFVSQTVECCRDLLAAAGCQADAILLAGGSSRIAMVARSLQASFGVEPHSAPEPEFAVVRGAAKWATMSDSRSGGPLAAVPGIKPLRWSIPAAEAELIDWLVAENAAYPDNATLARVRLPDGTLWTLKAGPASVLRELYVWPGDRVKPDNWLAAAGETPKPLKRVFDGRVSMLADEGLVYLMTASECHVLDPSSGELRLLCKERKPDTKPTSGVGRIMRFFGSLSSFPIGRFWELERGQHSLRILIGADRESAKWCEISRQTGRFLQEAPQ
jgi:molecular chaperone DnaK